MNDNDTTTKGNDEQKSKVNNNQSHDHGDDKTIIKDNWIKIIDGKFVCSECENESEPETNTEEGTVTANLDEIKADLKEFPSKIIYGICPVCGMEFVFKLIEDDLYLEPSELEK